jgi:glycosyltransferase involved in cell wall biosynthesis
LGLQGKGAEVTLSASTPLVSIGMPIYNEGRYLPAALDSLLAQDFADFELIISDNASEDATGKICLEYAARDPRIYYYRNERNVGATENFNRVFRRSRGKYFMWAAGHDVWAPTYLSRCLEALESDASIVLANSQARLIDQRGSELCLPLYQLDTRNRSLWLRFNLVLFQVSFVYPYSLIRASALRETHLCLKVPGPDHILALELSLLGPFAIIREPLLFLRDNRGERAQPGSTTESRKAFLERLYPGERNPGGRFPHARHTLEGLRVVKRARLGYGQKAALMACVMLAYLLKFYKYLPLILRRSLRSFLQRHLDVAHATTGKVRQT